MGDLKNSLLWNDKMIATAKIYVEHLAERAMSFECKPYVTFEVEVDLADYVPGSFGRCDCIMFGAETLVITDYKHGKRKSADGAIRARCAETLSADFREGY